MRRLLVPLLLIAATSPSLAAESKPKREPSPAQEAQHERMRQCSATAKEKGLHADPRKAFMKDCLSKHAAG
ncbi:PsiF family protein [Dankookia sp. P2]|uniref:PsiF family protein n=1 Tax=Dankookia sp. P2 TaxID=3423955 RepID=UPI003D66FC2E